MRYIAKKPLRESNLAGQVNEIYKFVSDMSDELEKVLMITDSTQTTLPVGAAILCGTTIDNGGMKYGKWELSGKIGTDNGNLYTYIRTE